MYSYQVDVTHLSRACCGHATHVIGGLVSRLQIGGEWLKGLDAQDLGFEGS